MNHSLCVFGEVLFDVFPDGQRVMGGAPFNVAWHLQAFSQAPRFVSRVGNDDDGKRIRAAMQDWGMHTGALQTDDRLPTGRVTVRLDRGEPTYEIVEPVAYDAIAAVAEDVSAGGFLYHGSLALRNDVSRQSLDRLKSARPDTVFLDVNLRSPWWDRALLLELLQQADWVKLNTDEFDLLYGSAAAEGGLSAFIGDYALRGVILTHGKAGAELVTASGERYTVAPDGDVDVVDTVGAGDAFTAVFILGLRRQWPLQTALQRAQNFASSIVARRGATVSDKGFYQDFIQQWKIAQADG